MKCSPPPHLPSPQREEGDQLLRLSMLDELNAGRAPHIDAGEEEQPDDVDEMPVPGGSLKAEMLLGAEMTAERAEQADDQEQRSDDDMEAVEARRHEEGRAIDVAAIVAVEGKGRVRIFIGLDAGEQQAERNGEGETPLQALAVVADKRVMRPGHGGARGEEDQRVDERQMPGIEDIDALGRPDTACRIKARGLHGLATEQAGIEEGPEPGHDAHDFG